MLLQLLEPGQTPAPHEDETDLAIGIDLGTTHSIVGISRDQKVEVLTTDQGEKLVPSVVTYQPDKERFLVGQEAKDCLNPAPDETIVSVKRYMGGRTHAPKESDREGQKQSLSGNHSFSFGEASYTPVEISAEILKALRHQAEKALSQKVTRAVITVPAYFDDTARTATRDAARLAGLDVLRLLNEPTAAALAYGLDQQADGLYAVYDLGGGTFDVSLLRFTKGVFQVLGTGGDTHLGGDDFDRCLLDKVLGERAAIYPDEHISDINIKKCLSQMRHLKERLTFEKSVEVTLSIHEKGSTHSITQEDFSALSAPLVSRTLNHLESVLQDASVEWKSVKGLILVGGATRMPCVMNTLKKIGIPILNELDPDLIVARGAALQAEALTKGSDTLLLDVTPLSLGLETMGDLTEKIIPRNSPIPISKAQEFTTYQDGQTALSLHIVQGERELASDCRSLAKFELHGIPPMAAGAARIEVTFTVDADGLLTVAAKEKTTGTSQRIEVKPTYGLSEDEVADLIRRSYEAGDYDMRTRLLQESKVDAKRLILAVTSALEKDGSLLPPNERKEIKSSLEVLEALCEGSDRDALINKIKSLEKATEGFAARRMNAHLKASLQGRELSDIEVQVKSTVK